MRRRILAALRSPAGWLLAGVLLAEFLAFDQIGGRRHTVVYPKWHDQAHYLAEAYTAFEFARTRGFVAALLDAATDVAAQGTLHDFLALLAFLVAGPSRSAALAVNMLALIGWQIALYLAGARLAGSRPIGLATAMLPLALAGPWQNLPGSAYDFRLDHLGLCGLGLTAALGLLTDGFQSRRASFAFGVAAGLTVVARYPTGTYLLLVFAGLAIWIAASPERKLRAGNLLRASAAALFIAGPTLWINHEGLQEHYPPRLYLGQESVLGSSTLRLTDSIAFVVRAATERHTGVFFAAVAVSGALILFAFRSKPAAAVSGETSVVPSPGATGATAQGVRNLEFSSAVMLARLRLSAPWVLAALFVLAPLVLLSLRTQKNDMLAGAVAAGIVALAAVAWSSAGRRCAGAVKWLFAAAALTMTLGAFVHRQVVPIHPPELLPEIRHVNTIADRLFARASAAALPRLRIAVDHVSDALDSRVLQAITYERKRVWLPHEGILPTGIGEPAEAEVMERLARSDFVFLTEESPEGGYPFDRRLASLRPQLRAWCEANLRAAESFTLLGRRITLYQRREFAVPIGCAETRGSRCKAQRMVSRGCAGARDYPSLFSARPKRSPPSAIAKPPAAL